MRLAAILLLFAIIGGLILVSRPATIAWMYDTGTFLPQDIDKARDWYVKAAGEGDIDAAFEAALMYDPAGPETPSKDDQAASLKLFRYAALRGHRNAQYRMALNYAHGWVGLPVDKEEALYWHLVAGGNDAFNDHDVQVLVNELTPAQVEKAKKRAAEWKPVVDN